MTDASKDKTAKEKEESELDKAIADSFPASDPIAFTTPEVASGSPKDGGARKREEERKPGK